MLSKGKCSPAQAPWVQCAAHLGFQASAAGVPVRTTCPSNDLCLHSGHTARPQEYLSEASPKITGKFLHSFDARWQELMCPRKPGWISHPFKFLGTGDHHAVSFSKASLIHTLRAVSLCPAPVHGKGVIQPSSASTLQPGWGTASPRPFHHRGHAGLSGFFITGMWYLGHTEFLLGALQSAPFLSSSVGINAFLCTPPLRLLITLDHHNTLWDNPQSHPVSPSFLHVPSFPWLLPVKEIFLSYKILFSLPSSCPESSCVSVCVYKTKAFHSTFWNPSSLYPSTPPNPVYADMFETNCSPRLQLHLFFGHAILAVVNNCLLHHVRHMLLLLAIMDAAST